MSKGGVAEDLVQDTLVRMAGAWRRIDQDGNPLAYARMIMFRIYLSRWRNLRRRPAQQPLVEIAAPGDPFAGVDIRDSLRRGLAGLPRLQRAVLVLTYLDDLADEDIAELLDRRPATTRSLHFREGPPVTHWTQRRPSTSPSRRWSMHPTDGCQDRPFRAHDYAEMHVIPPDDVHFCVQA